MDGLDPCLGEEENREQINYRRIQIKREGETQVAEEQEGSQTAGRGAEKCPGVAVPFVFLLWTDLVTYLAHFYLGCLCFPYFFVAIFGSLVQVAWGMCCWALETCPSSFRVVLASTEHKNVPCYTARSVSLILNTSVLPSLQAYTGTLFSPNIFGVYFSHCIL